jgi:hypothetical protein
MQWFENLDQYVDEKPLPRWMEKENNLSLIRLYSSGKTQPGWGAKDFMLNQRKNAFDVNRALRFYHKYGQPFGVVMRSLPAVCVDIDGKNGGIKTANALQLTETSAETSKSGNGFHVFYSVTHAEWDALLGYNEFPDIIGLIPGVDIKGVGVVYHYHNQRWNERELEPLPKSLSTLITRTKTVRHSMRMMRTDVVDMDPDDLVILHDQLKDQLNKKIPEGLRNQTLYAIGARMITAGYPSWDLALMERGHQLGLDEDEMADIVLHIEKYA